MPADIQEWYIAQGWVHTTAEPPTTPAAPQPDGAAAVATAPPVN
jgi:hypothetical protein